ncbi:hypothetical protein FZD47_20855 [Bacillus infantis]|uniref:Uncharacterized protein n=1 Tax=Bacillus infantis TaxID=324767 RepID=A0A5D4SDB6_9BACI|nr:hypothetical protein [Bacillus infantis]TYS60661.1 hypothetical protein FZD47_20855 [Bacillus infantis]
MLRDLLWFWDAKNQYQLQKAQGLAGLIGILFVIFFVWKWEETFYPFFNMVGLVGFAERTGLVSDLSVMTVINIMGVIFVLCLAYAIVAVAAVFFGILLLMFASSKVGENIIALALLPIMSPFIIIGANKLKKETMGGAFKDMKTLNSIQKKYKDLKPTNHNFQLYLHKLEEQDESFQLDKWSLSASKSISHLNKVLPSVKDDTNWLIGYLKPLDKLYLIFPNPIPAMASQSFDKKYKGVGIYGFTSQHWRANSSVPGSKGDYYFPVLEIGVKWKDGDLKMIVEDSAQIEAENIYLIDDLYQLKGRHIDAVFKEINDNRPDVSEAIKRAHIAFYLLPIAYGDLEEKERTSESDLFFKQCGEVRNADVYSPIYAADVQEEIIKYAKDGEAWAIKWFSKVD